MAALVTIASIASPPTGTAIAWTGAATAALTGLIMLTARTGGESRGLRADGSAGEGPGQTYESEGRIPGAKVIQRQNQLAALITRTALRDRRRP
jgi:hypothetical protein